MSGFKAVHAVGEDWAHVAQSVVDGLGETGRDANFGFLYATDHLAEDLGSVITYLRQRTGIAHWVGSIATAVCGVGGEVTDSPSAAVLVGRFPERAFRIFPSLETGVDQLSGGFKNWIADSGAAFGIVHGDPQNPMVPEIITDLALLTSGFFVGGLSSSETEFYQVADRRTGGGLSGVMFAPEVEVMTGVSQGCAPISVTHVVSDAVDNVIIGLDGKRALDVLKEDIGPELAGDLRRIEGRVFMALMVEGSDTGDYMVRNLAAIDPARGWIAIGGEITPGDRILFVRRDPDTALEDLRKTAQRLADRVGGKPRAGVYVSCVGRGANMFGEPGMELAIIKEILGDFPIAGFHSAGEISSNRLYGYTGVLTLFV